MQLLKAENSISDDLAAKHIGGFFPEISDKLLNYIQLSSGQFRNNDLAEASLNQRAIELGGFSFSDAITFKTEKLRFLRFVLPLIFIGFLLVALFPSSFVGSSERIINFHKEYVPVAPFRFEIGDNLIAYRNENYVLNVTLTGDAIPQEAWFVSNNKRIKMVNAGMGSFELLFNKIANDKSFTVEAASFNSAVYHLKVVDRPSLSGFSVNLKYPSYLGVKPETFNNVGSFEVPEGTQVNWLFNSKFTQNLTVLFDDDSMLVEPENGDEFKFGKRVFNSLPYQIELNNSYAKQLGNIEYEVSVIKDQTPEIDVKVLADTVLFRYIVFAGNLSDDHGLRNLNLFYTKNNKNENRVPIPLDNGSSSQSLFYQWILDSLNLKPNDNLLFYLQLTDNDAVNRYKTTKSKVFSLKVPGKEKALEELIKSKDQAKESISESAEEAKKLKENIDKLVEDLKGTKKLSWQEEQMLENLIEQKEKLTEELEKLQEQTKMLNEQQKHFEEPSQETLEKQEQLQELVNNLLDEETRQLYEKLKKLLESHENTESVQDVLQKIQNKELNLEQELERALEFFKQLQYEQKLEEVSQELDQLKEQQTDLLEKTGDKSQPTDSLASDQGKLQEKFKELQKELRDAKELNQDLKRPNPMEDTSGEEESVKDEQNKSKENLEKNNRNKSKLSQQNATKKMEQIAKKLENMQSAMQMMQMQEDLGDLQTILNNLIELSFDQEQLMKDFKEVNQSDPAFIKLSQEQLDLKDDSKIINDSLIALSSRVLAISSFVTRELNEMNQHMDASIKSIRDRNKGEATGNQQLTMTSTNNLALMLDNVMKQMQENLANMQGKGEQDKKGPPKPSLSELQKQLNQQIRELSQSEKSGRELSEELAKLAAEQERIRKALEEAEKKYGNNQGEAEKMMQEMEKTELDLVNKKITRQTLQRQQQILTRLLETEKSMRERELDERREAKSATQYEKMLPKAFEDYIKQREKEIELLKTVPPRLMPFFKMEVNKYFERVKQQESSINN